MKLHHLRTAFLVICLLLVCSQGESQTFNNDTNIDVGTNAEFNNTIIIDPLFHSDFINNDTINLGVIDEIFFCYDIANPNCFNNDTININNTDPAVPEPTTLSLLAMSLLFAGRRWR